MGTIALDTVLGTCKGGYLTSNDQKRSTIHVTNYNNRTKTCIL